MKKPIKESRSIFEKHNIHLNLDKINQKILDPNFWKNKTEAEKIIKEKKLYEDLLKILDSSIGNQLSNSVLVTDSFPEKVILSIKKVIQYVIFHLVPV